MAHDEGEAVIGNEEETMDEEDDEIDTIGAGSVGPVTFGITTLLSNSSALTGINLILGGDIGDIMSKSY